MADIFPKKIFRSPFSPYGHKRSPKKFAHAFAPLYGVFSSQKKFARAWTRMVGMTVLPTTDARTEPVTVRGDSITTFFRPPNWGILWGTHYLSTHLLSRTPIQVTILAHNPNYHVILERNITL